MSHSRVASSLYDLIECRTVDHEVADDWEGLSAPWLNPDLVTILELTHMKLARGDAVVVAMRSAVDIQAAHSAYALATVVIEAHRMRYAVVDEALIEDVEHLQKRAVRRDVIDRICLKMSFYMGVFLYPDM